MKRQRENDRDVKVYKLKCLFSLVLYHYYIDYIIISPSKSLSLIHQPLCQSMKIIKCLMVAQSPTIALKIRQAKTALGFNSKTNSFFHLGLNDLA